ncbi:MAG: hypothetical protein HQL84_01320 [Magnetococcales bacterium]|nr:hypothetical protein [Magnetococcales bacterium]MBF0148668.1 hypothetical protein [Magnetococcales bacterium]MBF0174099.1 hypothetical protein [Magnetococcales bacterium]MBF0349368.1 hypothetical protein [Magnetococcales bacterium]MBF0631474.1 hypothetical protein [Magnetococcales bacterium]
MKHHGQLRFFRFACLIWVGMMMTHPPLGGAVEIERLHVDHKENHYFILASTLVALSPQQVHAGIVDIEHLERLSSDIIDSRLIERKTKNRLIARMNLRSCIMVFCLERTLTETVIIKDREIAFIITPAKNGFRSGWVRWKLLNSERGTRVLYTSELVPDFWVPPMVGPFLLTGKFRDNTIEVMERLEQQHTPKAKEGMEP